MIKRILTLGTLFLLLSNFSEAKVTHLNYKATFGIFGTVGTIKNKLTQNSKTYQIDTTVKMAGLAKVLMGGQTERYISKGRMKNGIMVSDFYQMITKKKGKTTSKEYHIHHKAKYVTKRYRKWVKGKLVADTKKRLKFYAKDDLLTLYFNLGKRLTKKGKTYTGKAVGLEKQNGIVKLTVPTDSQSGQYKKDLGKAKLYVKAKIKQKNFRKKKGDILLAIDDDGYIKKSVIKDVLMYGDAKLIRIK